MQNEHTQEPHFAELTELLLQGHQVVAEHLAEIEGAEDAAGMVDIFGEAYAIGRATRNLAEFACAENEEEQNYYLATTIAFLLLALRGRVVDRAPRVLSPEEAIVGVPLARVSDVIDRARRAAGASSATDENGDLHQEVRATLTPWNGESRKK
jgi:hypothetical protein